jgi:hypothetical protein
MCVLLERVIHFWHCRKSGVDAMSHQKRVEGVMRARLYFLSQSGPKAFIIGSDDVQRKYKVIIGKIVVSH